ncbi:MAG: cyclase family protein [Pseudonocardiaceae bacterium]|nr:cyclase family protein [Pseudonocardiaceae bacterium]
MHDLSLPLSEELPAHWATHMPFQAKIYNWFDREETRDGHLFSRCGPYYTRWLLLDEHTGTHFDAPSHFVPPPGSDLPHSGSPGAVTASHVPVRQFMGKAAVIDVPYRRGFDEVPVGESYEFGPDVVAGWEAENGTLTSDHIVLFRTGWDEKYQAGHAGSAYTHDVLVTKTAPGWPAPDTDCISLLLSRGIGCAGTDGASMGSAHNGQPVHVLGLSSGMVFIEALGNLGSLPVDGAYFVFLPIKVDGGSGAPGRAIAFVPGFGTD